LFREKFYRRICWWSLFSVFFLFFLGGLVRSTGAGMGCPDWPKCFGQWIPPTSDKDLPDNYEKFFLEKRKTKIERLTAFLENIGRSDYSARIHQATWLMEHEPYSFRKAYTEYINRVWGALTGIFALLCAISSFQFIKSKTSIFVYSVLGLILVGFNGWLGSLVVDTNLLPGMVTIHFFFAFAAFLMYILAFAAHRGLTKGSKSRLTMLTSLLLFTLVSVEVLVGSIVRENVDQLAMYGTWVNLRNYGLLGGSFDFHRISGMVLLVACIFLVFTYRKLGDRSDLQFLAYVLLGVFILQISAGASNLSFGFPALSQIAHITLGAASFGICAFLAIQEFLIWRTLK
jgi:cytochrome c oxidase assembly protein subunit 15